MAQTLAKHCPSCGSNDIIPISYCTSGCWDANPVDQNGRPVSHFVESCFCDPCRELHCSDCEFEWTEGFLDDYDAIYATRHFWDIVEFILELRKIIWSDYALPAGIEARIHARHRLSSEDVMYLQAGADIDSMVTDFSDEIALNQQRLSSLESSDDRYSSEDSSLLRENIARCQAAIEHCQSLPATLRQRYPELARAIYILADLTAVVAGFHSRQDPPAADSSPFSRVRRDHSRYSPRYPD